MSEQRGSISGGQALRKLRERMGWSQLDVAVETEVITQTNYSKIERGRSQPSREKLEDILTAFEATKHEQEDVLKFFGYLPETPLPGQDDIEAVIKHSQTLLLTATVPVFLVDISTRLIHWNRLYAQLLGEEGHEILETMRGRPFMQMAFERKQELGDLVDDLDAVLLDEIATTCRRLDAFKQEAWVAPFLDEIAYDTPTFAHYWEQSQQAVQLETLTAAISPAAPMPVRYNVPGILAKPLSFFGYAQIVPMDTRFQLIFLLPSDAFTLNIIDGWRTSEDTV